MISPMPGVTEGKPGAAMTAGARRQRRRGQRRGAAGAERVRRLPGDHQAVAGDAADDLGRRSALHRHLLVAVRGPLLRRRRRQEGRGRRPLAARPGRRRDERVRPPDVDHRDRVGPGLPPEGGRGGRGRRHRRDHRPGDRGVRDLARPRPATAARTWSPELRTHVAKEIGAIARPRQIMVVEELPKTRSGKIMRRLLRDIAENRELGDVTTLTDSSVMDLIKENLSKPRRRRARTDTRRGRRRPTCPRRPARAVRPDQRPRRHDRRRHPAAGDRRRRPDAGRRPWSRCSGPTSARTATRRCCTCTSAR